MQSQSHAALILIDIQAGFNHESWGSRSNPDFTAATTRLLGHWRRHSLPVVHVRHDSLQANSPLNPHHSGNRFMPEVAPMPGEMIVGKHMHSAFIGTPLDIFLRQSQIGTVVLAGLTADHCVSTTARMAADLGFTTVVAADATAAFPRKSPAGGFFAADLVQALALASIKDEFAAVLSVDEICDLPWQVAAKSHTKLRREPCATY